MECFTIVNVQTILCIEYKKKLLSPRANRVLCGNGMCRIKIAVFKSPAPIRSHTPHGEENNNAQNARGGVVVMCEVNDLSLKCLLFKVDIIIKRPIRPSNPR